MQFAEAGRNKGKLITACLLSRVAVFFFFICITLCVFTLLTCSTATFSCYIRPRGGPETFIPLRPDQLKTAKIKNTSLKKKKNLERVKMFRATFKFHKPIMFAARDRPSPAFRRRDFIPRSEKQTGVRIRFINTAAVWYRRSRLTELCLSFSVKP